MVWKENWKMKSIFFSGRKLKDSHVENWPHFSNHFWVFIEKLGEIWKIILLWGKMYEQLLGFAVKFNFYWLPIKIIFILLKTTGTQIVSVIWVGLFEMGYWNTYKIIRKFVTHGQPFY